MKPVDLKLIKKYITGTSDDEEKRIIESYFSIGEESDELRSILEKEWNNAEADSFEKTEKLDHLLDHIHHIMRKREFEKNNTFLRKAVVFYMKAAAILLIPIIIISIISNNKILNKKITEVKTEKGDPKIEFVTSTIFAPLGSRVTFCLPDSTIGMLNSGSKLTYSIPFITNRKVKLEGEAWFDVSHDESHPFILSAGKSTVNVLGTSFNISAYPAENYIEVVLSRGKIEFIDDNNKSITTIYPSERLIYQNGSITKSVTDPTKYTSWTEGKLVFRGDPMSEVGRRIERWYNIKFELADKELEKYSFRGTFVDDSLEDVLKLLSMTSPISYEITPRKLVTDGIYQKERVTIYLKK